MSKYGNKRTEVDGYKFDSQAEARRYSELKLMERAGEICYLEVHPRYTLNTLSNDQARRPVTVYEADFSYRLPDMELVVEDVKSEPTKTAMYRLKKKWLKLEYGIEIQEIEA